MSDIVIHADADAECGLLGAMLLSPKVVADIAATLEPEAFYSRANAAIFRAIRALDDKGAKLDAVVVADYLQQHNLLEEAGGRAYVHTLASAVPAGSRAPEYRDIIQKHHVSRQLDELGHAISQMQLSKASPKEVMAFATERLEAIEGKAITHDVIDIRVAMEEHWLHLEEIAKQGTHTAGIPSGFRSIDKLLSGLRRSALLILAGRPGMGKTAFGLALLASVAKKNPNGAVAMFCLEQPVVELSNRLVAAHTKINHESLQTGQLTDSEWSVVQRAQQELSQLPMFLDDAYDTSISDLRAKARRLRRKHGLNLLVVDYVQLLAPDRKMESREREVADMSRRLKMLAKELDCPVLALAQLNRQAETRADKRPMLSDLRESGALEQDADSVLFVYRDEYYDKDSPDKGLVEIIAAKNRHGPTGTTKLGFRPDCGWFADLAPSNQKEVKEQV